MMNWSKGQTTSYERAKPLELIYMECSITRSQSPQPSSRTVVITRVAESISFLPTENLQLSFGYLPPRPPRRSSGQRLSL